jgi:hypothetical protein
LSSPEPDHAPEIHVRSWLDRVDPRNEWPAGLVRLGVALVVAISVGLGLVYFVKALDRLGDDARVHSEANYDDRELAGGNSLAVDKSALYEARALIPADETYRVVAGPDIEGANELTEPHIGEYARSFLMPRRPADDARWILCYGCDLSRFEPDLELLWRNGVGIAIGRLPG